MYFALALFFENDALNAPYVVVFDVNFWSPKRKLFLSTYERKLSSMMNNMNHKNGWTSAEFLNMLWFAENIPFIICDVQYTGVESAATMAMTTAQIQSVNVFEIHQSVTSALSPSVILNKHTPIIANKRQRGGAKWDRTKNKKSSDSAKQHWHIAMMNPCGHYTMSVRGTEQAVERKKSQQIASQAGGWGIRFRKDWHKISSMHKVFFMNGAAWLKWSA